LRTIAPVVQEVELLGGDESLGARRRRHVDGEVVAAPAEVVEAVHAMHLARHVPRVGDREVGVVAVDVHAEGYAGVGDMRADGAQSDDADALAHDLASHEGLLRGLRLLVDVVVVGMLAAPVDAAEDVARADQDETHDQLLDGVRVGSRRVEDDDAVLGIALVGDVVDAGAGAGDAADGLRQLEVEDVLGAQENGVDGVVELVGEVVVTAEPREVLGLDVVVQLDVAHATSKWTMRLPMRARRCA
jgi:hypothetical protein